MSGASETADAIVLPAEIPIFPLIGALLLPGGRLPLNIFEPRYRNMVEDALGAGRIIGMVQPSGPETTPEGSVGDIAPIYGTGCAGRIIAFSETDDGRYLITLRGLCRFNVVEELSLARGYRRVRADFGPFREDLAAPEQAPIDRDRLTAAMRTYFETRGLSANWSAVDEAGDSELVTSLAMICPFEPKEKQALLECPTPDARARMMITLFEMSAHDDPGGPTTAIN